MSATSADIKPTTEKLPKERQVLCTNLRVPIGIPKKAFVRAWNLMVGHGLRYTASFREMARYGDDPLIRYRANEMARLLIEQGGILEFDYDLAIKVLDHVEVTPVGKFAVIFLTGTRVTV